MKSPEPDGKSITEKAQAAFQEVRESVIERARQTKTPIIIYADNRIQSLTPEQFEAREKR